MLIGVILIIAARSKELAVDTKVVDGVCICSENMEKDTCITLKCENIYVCIVGIPRGTCTGLPSVTSEEKTTAESKPLHFVPMSGYFFDAGWKVGRIRTNLIESFF